MNAQQFLEKHKAQAGWVLVAGTESFTRVFLVDKESTRYRLQYLDDEAGLTCSAAALQLTPVSLWKPLNFWDAARWYRPHVSSTLRCVTPQWDFVAEYKEEETYKQIAQKQADELRKLRDEKEKAERNADYYKTEMEREQRLNAHDDCQAEIDRLRHKVSALCKKLVNAKEALEK